ncbi:hypothetical protein CYMTET_55697 [Cymbomonas tetramitiformis]|uniref:ditrans,polycis-polyprenyl diphosphate synthase [(2E,6E)-farnesyldiphosphate specific] n=1 Tax=Cymbomonas tetramitiformis TaxID=36881 RepID=A0AAE0ENB6_9CHLO|nr:hypothetical protein CYMTET_55697 [Cymbomonas tetramitiformis]
MADILVWCVRTGVRQIALYDSAGVFRANWQRLSGHIDELQHSTSSTYQSYRIGFGVEYQTTAGTGREIEIALLSLEQSRNQLIETCCSKVETRRLEAREEESASPTRGVGKHPELGNTSASSSQLMQLLTQRCEESCVELLLLFGDVVTLAGFPPWQTHLCEILHMVPIIYHPDQMITVVPYRFDPTAPI